MSKKKSTPIMNQTPAGEETPALNSVTEARIEELEANLKEQEEKHLRLYAEFENYRKRSIKEKADYLSTANKDTIVAMLPILDDFERAVANNEKVEDVQILKAGFSLIFNKINQIMESKGLKAMHTLDQPFDYELHEAIANVSVPEEDRKGKVIDQVEKGYFLNDKVIRYAKVVVGQ
jgi:molecular chaperone GrpE